MSTTPFITNDIGSERDIFFIIRKHSAIAIAYDTFIKEKTIIQMQYAYNITLILEVPHDLSLAKLLKQKMRH